MTSAEAFEKLVEELKWCCNDGVELTEYDKHILDPIAKDLFILQLIKPLIEIIENTKDTAGPRYYIKLRQDVFITDETRKMLKEWSNERQEN